MKTTAEIHNIVYIVNSYVCVGILKSWIRKRVIKDFCLNVQIQRKLHASRQRSIKMFCSSTIICSVCFVRKSLFQIGNKWSAIEFLFLNEATSQTAFLYLGWSPYRYFREISAVFFIWSLILQSVRYTLVCLGSAINVVNVTFNTTSCEIVNICRFSGKYFLRLSFKVFLEIKKKTALFP